MSKEFRRDFLNLGRAFASAAIAGRLLGASESSEVLFLPVSGGLLTVKKRLCESSKKCVVEREEILTSGLKAFIEKVKDGSGRTIKGVYIEDKLEYSVIQQPVGHLAYVAQWPIATEFNLRAFGIEDDIGLLLEALYIPDTVYDVTVGDKVFLVNGNGGTRGYGVTGIRRFLALSPYYEHTELKELNKSNETGKWYTADALFKEMYSDADGDNDELVILTCELNERKVPIIRRFIKAHFDPSL
jgi:hypothetical protein